MDTTIFSWGINLSCHPQKVVQQLRTQEWKWVRRIENEMWRRRKGTKDGNEWRAERRASFALKSPSSQKCFSSCSSPFVLPSLALQYVGRAHTCMTQIVQRLGSGSDTTSVSELSLSRTDTYTTEAAFETWSHECASVCQSSSRLSVFPA